MNSPDKIHSTIDHLKRNRAKYALGVIVASTLISVPALDDSYEKIVQDAPVLAGAVVGSEALFVGGLALVVGSQRKRLTTKDIFKRSYLKEEIFDKPIEDNTMLRSGVAVNTIGAVGTSVTIGVGALNTLPNTMLPAALTFVAADLAATAIVRYNIYKGIKDSKIDSIT